MSEKSNSTKNSAGTAAGTKESSMRERVLLVVDIFFVLILCFVVLLITMFCQNLLTSDTEVLAYVLDPKTLIPVILAIAAFVAFLVKMSTKDLKEIVEIEYADAADEGDSDERVVNN
ncbi:hypothetical protein [Phoenicibacter congonensis]|uniref:hypothetical protein n=1 Tax=Phoenicibacter congonensis TaxID=1944646 RepID=UPI0009A76BD0|nr:hypothetical protein [Phoenicibacter congonensis]